MTTSADCDALKQLVEKDKNNLIRRKMNVEAELETYTENSINVPAEMQLISAEIAALDTIVPALPEGKQKTNMVTRRKQLDARLSVINGRAGNYGLVALIDKQTEVLKLEAQIEALNALLAAIAAHRATLVV